MPEQEQQHQPEHQQQHNRARTAVEGTAVTITGVLTVTDSFNGPAFIQDATGGIAVFDEQVFANATLKVGDSITVAGTRAAFNDQRSECKSRRY